MTLYFLKIYKIMAYNKKKQGGLVYSTDHGKMCPGCSMPLEHCNCSQNQLIPQGDGVVRVQRETKGRKGKGVSIITGLALSKGELKRLATELKVKCGTGGTVKDSNIEIQGDNRDTIIDFLKSKGYNAKKAGG